MDRQIMRVSDGVMFSSAQEAEKDCRLPEGSISTALAEGTMVHGELYKVVNIKNNMDKILRYITEQGIECAASNKKLLLFNIDTVEMMFKVPDVVRRSKYRGMYRCIKYSKDEYYNMQNNICK